MVVLIDVRNGTEFAICSGSSFASTSNSPPYLLPFSLSLVPRSPPRTDDWNPIHPHSTPPQLPLASPMSHPPHAPSGGPPNSFANRRRSISRSSRSSLGGKPIPGPHYGSTIRRADPNDSAIHSELGSGSEDGFTRLIGSFSATREELRDGTPPLPSPSSSIPTALTLRILPPSSIFPPRLRQSPAFTRTIPPSLHPPRLCPSRRPCLVTERRLPLRRRRLISEPRQQLPLRRCCRRLDFSLGSCPWSSSPAQQDPRRPTCGVRRSRRVDPPDHPLERLLPRKQQ